MGAPLDYVFRSIWYHIVLTKNATSLILYINGEAKGSIQIINPSNITPSQLLGINLWNNSKTATFKVASTAVWLKSLSAHEVKQIYQSQLLTNQSQSGISQATGNNCTPINSVRAFLEAEGVSRR